MAPSSVVPRRSASTIGGGIAVVLLASILGTTAAATSSSADPIASKKAEAAALARKIDAQGLEIQVLAEQYDGARLHADQVNQQLATAAANLSLAQQQATKARTSLGQQAVTAYLHGGYLSPPKSAPLSGHLDLVVQQAYFGLATNNEADALDQMRVAERHLTEEQAILQVAQKDSRNAVATLAARQKAVEDAAAADKATLAQVQGELVQLVAQQQAQLAAQRIAQEKAALAAQLARAQAQALAQARAAAAAAAVAAAQAQAEAAAAAQARARAQAAARARQAIVPVAPPLRIVPLVALPAGRPGPPPVPAPRPPPVPPGSSAGMIALSFARAQLGKPYQWGAAGPDSYDCSGLTMRAWQAAGVSLPHFAAAQYAAVAHIVTADLQPGDLVFFGTDIHHVGIYAGGGQMIDAPFTGAVVRYDSIFWGDLLGGGRPG
jgi:cell wall-associated NlpC family hydrolase